MPPSTALSEPALIAHIQRLPRARASFKQLIREFGARGDLIEFKPGYYVSAAFP